VPYNRASEILTVDQMELPIFCGNMNFIGLRVAGTWAGSVSFFGSFDSIKYQPATVTPYVSGAGVQSSTANGSWFIPSQNYTSFKVRFGRTSGSAIVYLVASTDGTYQLAYLDPTDRFKNSVATNATNTLTIAANANRASRLRALKVSVLGGAVTWAAQPALTIKDGATLLWAFDLPTTNGAIHDIPLPQETTEAPGGLINTPGNTLVIACAAGGASVQTNINCDIAPV
jgi:hypothetical protein